MSLGRGPESGAAAGGSSFGAASLRRQRAFDLAVAFPLALLLLPLIAVLAIAVKLDSPGPAFIGQLRIGRGGAAFRMWKLRTMTADSDPRTHEATVRRLILGSAFSADGAWQSPSDDPRITRAGRVLRAAGLDELPQLINVLAGEMSLVGPRPALPYEVELWRDWHFGRLAARPGITGLWQATARGTADFDAMVRLDLEYIAHRSIAGDIRILARTPLAAWRAARPERAGRAVSDRAAGGSITPLRRP